MVSLTDYQKFWAEKFKQDEDDKKLLLLHLRRSAAEAARLLVEHFKAKKVYLYGSIIDGVFFHKHSDIDLAVEGLPPQKYFTALAKVFDVFQGKFRVDLLPLEDVLPEMREKIEKKGERLYG